jgi:hypothetical protein
VAAEKEYSLKIKKNGRLFACRSLDSQKDYKIT